MKSMLKNLVFALVLAFSAMDLFAQEIPSSEEATNHNLHQQQIEDSEYEPLYEYLLYFVNNLEEQSEDNEVTTVQDSADSEVFLNNFLKKHVHEETLDQVEKLENVIEDYLKTENNRAAETINYSYTIKDDTFFLMFPLSMTVPDLNCFGVCYANNRVELSQTMDLCNLNFQVVIKYSFKVPSTITLDCSNPILKFEANNFLSICMPIIRSCAIADIEKKPDSVSDVYQETDDLAFSILLKKRK